jgi:Calcineurin-like phosphoesterase
MIAQLLNREFLRKSIKQLKENASEEAAQQELGDSEALKRARETQVSPLDLREAEESLQALTEREALIQAEPEDGRAFFPRDATASIVQSALLEFYENRRPEMIEKTEARGAVGEDNFVTDEQLKGLTLSGDDTRGLFGAFEQTDVRWAACLAAMGIRRLRGRRKFNEQPAPPFKIGNKARLVLVGDWGSGLPRAQKVGDYMREEFQKSGGENRDLHVIHLGDVYYSGWKREYEKHFLPYWPVKPGEENKITSWSTNANHDMYSGGEGYYDFLLKDPRFARQKQSSFFSLENDHWQILGLDTGYEEHNLYWAQAEWAKQRASEAPKKDLMLLSHHQMFSPYEKGGEKLEEKLRPLLDAGRVRSWFWGHEHRCVCYKPQRKIEYPRLIGHGGVPVYASSKAVPAGVKYEYREKFDTGLEEWAIFGFAVLDFDDKEISVRYINENGKEHFSEKLTASTV